MYIIHAPGNLKRYFFIYGVRILLCMSELIEAFRNEFPRFSEVDEITGRSCSSDKYSGTEYKFSGNFVPVKPIIDVVSREEGLAIEHLAHVEEPGNVALVVFVAEVPPRTRAFV